MEIKEEYVEKFARPRVRQGETGISVKERGQMALFRKERIMGHPHLRRIDKEAVIDKLMGEIEGLEAELHKHRWIPVSERLPEKGECLVLCEGKIRQVQIRIRTDDEDGKMTSCAISDLGCVYLGCDECITHWKPIILPEQTPKETK